MLSAIVGVNWGDEGKGRIVDYLSQDFDIVSRYQGGNKRVTPSSTEKGHVYSQSAPVRHSARRHSECHGHGNGY